MATPIETWMPVAPFVMKRHVSLSVAVLLKNRELDASAPASTVEYRTVMLLGGSTDQFTRAFGAVTTEPCEHARQRILCATVRACVVVDVSTVLATAFLFARVVMREMY